LRDSGDVVVPFLLENLSVRGALIQLQRTWARMQLGHNYNGPLTGILGEAAAATGLIAQSLKFDGKITLQISGDGPLSMLVMQSTDNLELRGMVSAPDVADDVGYAQLVGNSRCAITVGMSSMEQPYQGIVQMLGETLGESFENYFSRSAQIESHMVLVADDLVCGGILLQQMPEQGTPVADDWHRLALLAATLRTSDFSPGIGAPLVGRLFAQDDVRVFAARPVVFRCGCSRERAEEVLGLLGESDTRDACAQQGRVDVICEFCGQKQSFDAVDISRIFSDQSLQGSDTVH